MPTEAWKQFGGAGAQACGDWTLLHVLNSSRRPQSCFVERQDNEFHDPLLQWSRVLPGGWVLKPVHESHAMFQVTTEPSLRKVSHWWWARACWGL